MKDLIDRQAALDAIDRIFDRCEEIENHFREDDPDRTGYRMLPDYLTVRRFLTQQTAQTAQPEITLESAIDYLHSIEWMQEHDRIMVESAQPERKKGEWIIHNVLSHNCQPTNRHFAECSECGTLTREWRGNLFPPSLRFCPNCGAEMQKGENDG